MDSPLSCPVKGAGWESPFLFAGEETEAQGGRRSGTPEGSEAGQESGSWSLGVFRKHSTARSYQGALFFSFTTLGDESCLVWGQSLMSPGQNELTPAGDGLAVWVRNAGLMGECPAWGWTCGLPPFPGLRQSSKTSPGPPLAQVAHLHTCGFSWGSFSFLGQGVLQRPLLGRQTRRGFFPSAWGTRVSLTLQPPCKAQPQAGSFPSP